LSAAIKLLDNEGSSGLLGITPDKTPRRADTARGNFLPEPLDYIPPCVFDFIDEEVER
jgi:hypothetical protein